MGNAWAARWDISVGLTVATVVVLVRSLAVLVDGAVVGTSWGVILASIDVLRSVFGDVGFFGRLLNADIAWCKMSTELLVSGVSDGLAVRVLDGNHGCRIVDGLGWVIVAFRSITLHSKES